MLRNKTLLTLAAAAFSIPLQARALEADVSGTWQIEAKCERGGAVPVCIFQQAGMRITGTCKGPNSLGTSSGNVKGQQVEFVWESLAYTRLEAPIRTTFSGTVNANGTMSGKASNAVGGTCTFTGAKR